MLVVPPPVPLPGNMVPLAVPCADGVLVSTRVMNSLLTVGVELAPLFAVKADCILLKTRLLLAVPCAVPMLPYGSDMGVPYAGNAKKIFAAVAGAPP